MHGLYSTCHSAIVAAGRRQALSTVAGLNNAASGNGPLAGTGRAIDTHMGRFILSFNHSAGKQAPLWSMIG